jgi:hypothetical protein
VSDQEFQEYLKGRFETLVKYYDNRSKSNKRWHRVCSVLIILISASLVPIVSTGVLADHRVIGGVLAASVVVATAIGAYFQFNENWLNYRATWDALQREPHLRIAGVGEYYESKDRNSLFVQRVEAIVSEQGSEWLSRHKRMQERPLISQEPPPKN